MFDNTGTGRFFMMWVNSDFERLFFSFFHFFARSYGCLEKKTCTSDEHNYYCNVTTTLVHGLYLSQSFLAQISFNYAVVWSKPNETMKLYAIKKLIESGKVLLELRWFFNNSDPGAPSLSLFYHSFMGWKVASLHGRNEIKMASKVLCKFVIAMFFHQKQKHDLFMKPMQHYFFYDDIF